MCDSDSGLSISMNESQNDSPTQGLVFIRVTMPDENSETFSFSPTDLIVDVKLTAIKRSSSCLKDELNYGLFLPPSKGKAGKFLQEDRMLLDYPFEGSVGHLELKYKQRVYRVLRTNVNKLRKINTKANFRQFIEYVKVDDVDKVNKWLNKGLDPNFQWKPNGETPLTMAVQLEKPYEMVMALVAGGAHLDYRASDSMTPIHRASEKGNYEAIKVLLDLGQSPNTRDKADLTPLYYAVLNNTISLCVERLLFDHSPLGIADEAGLQEIHQACRFGRVQHLEILLAYGAEINVQTSKNGNTPLHICAYTGQESCARMLLFRGADKNIKNFNGHTTYEQAMISNHIEIADLIKGFHEQDVVPIRNYLKRNLRRRSFSRIRSQQRCSSMGRLNDFSKQNGITEVDGLPEFEKDHCNTLKGNHMIRNNTWMNTSISGYQLNSISDSIDFNDNKNYMATSDDQNNHLNQSRSAYNLNKLSNGINQKCHDPNDIVYPNYSATMRPSQSRRTGRSSTPAAPRTSSESFKTTNLQDRHSTYRPSLDPAWISQTNESGSETASIFSVSSSMRTPSTNSVRNGSAILQLLLANRDSIADLDTTNLPRMIALQRGPNGFGFVVRGKKGISGNFTPCLECPASQYLEKVEPHSAASKAGLKAGDFILEVNNINVTTMSHEAVVSLIRGSSDILGLKVITVDSDQINSTPKLSHQSAKSNKFYESSDNIYSSKAKKSNYEDKFSNKHCESVENHWPRNTENAYKTICRDSFYRNQNNFSILLENSTNKSSSNDFICGEKLKSLRLDPSPSVSSMDVPSYRTPAPAPPSSKPVLTTGTLSKSVFQNGPYKKAECNLTISLKSRPTLSEKTFDSVNKPENSLSFDHPPPPTPPPISSSSINLIPSPPPLMTTPNKTSSSINSELPTGILKKTPHDKFSESIKPSKNLEDARNQDIWSDQLLLPPPPPPEEFELNVTEPATQHSNCQQNSNGYDINNHTAYKSFSLSQTVKKTSFEDNLRRAVAERRRLIEMASGEDDHDSESILNKSCHNTTYTENNTRTLKQQAEIVSSNEKSFKTAAEKLHFQTLSSILPTNNTIPPPENFKDFDNSMNKVHCNTELNNDKVPIATKPKLPLIQPSYTKNVNTIQGSRTIEQSKLNSVNSLTNISCNGAHKTDLLREISTFKQNTVTETKTSSGKSIGHPRSTTPSSLQSSSYFISEVPKIMWSTK
ncbi:Protein shank [Schistosoma haematobium]|uniref:Protein shank n=2 Tax=Schistosoma haematobium TaxID=6185 RepID=A0A6A5DY12_SCHHA|nr:Protein shank [Schistosoma haematobium]KAH9590403.1 Protein shank [Schistosoma haematobium]CAH8656224.1 unnamed protein product [Schistosoma haematobium]